jgi:hypothetical protein
VQCAHNLKILNLNIEQFFKIFLIINKGIFTQAKCLCKYTIKAAVLALVWWMF